MESFYPAFSLSLYIYIDIYVHVYISSSLGSFANKFDYSGFHYFVEFFN